MSIGHASLHLTQRMPRVRPLGWAVAVGLLDDHLKHCVLDAARMEGDQAEQKIKEASDAIARLVRS